MRNSIDLENAKTRLKAKIGLHKANPILMRNRQERRSYIVSKPQRKMTILGRFRDDLVHTSAMYFTS